MWLVLDGNGAIWRCDASQGGTLELLLEGHGGSVSDVALSSVGRFAASVATDGGVVVQDYGTQQLVAVSRSQAPCSAVEWAPPTLDPSGASLVVGHEDGTLHVAAVGASRQLVVTQALKPHAGRLTCASFSPDGKVLATAGEDGIVFLLEASRGGGQGEGAVRLKPRGFVKVTGAARRISWRGDGRMMLVACAWDEARMGAPPGQSGAGPADGAASPQSAASGSVAAQASGALQSGATGAIACAVPVPSVDAIPSTEHSFELPLPVLPLSLELPLLKVQVEVEEDPEEEDRLRKLVDKRRQDRLNNGEPEPEEPETVDSLRQDGSFRGEDGRLYRIEDRVQDPQALLAAAFSPLPPEAVQEQR